MLIDNTQYKEKIKNSLEKNNYKENDVFKLFYENISKKICWNSNAIEGNTLTLDETIRLLDYDETIGKHKYSEYFEAKCLYRAINSFLNYNEKINITEQWICYANSVIMGKDPTDIDKKELYRTEAVGVGNIISIDYIAPDYKLVPELMHTYVDKINNSKFSDLGTLLSFIAISHLEFERIHPFIDGNGRTGRLILNQMLMNNDMLPIYFLDNSAYRNAFKIYNESKDYSKLLHLICKSELSSIDLMNHFINKYNTVNLNIKSELNKNYNKEDNSKCR